MIKKFNEMKSEGFKKLQISKKERKFSPTPIVEIHINDKGEEKEKIVFVSTETKKIGDEKSKLLIQLWNDYIYNRYTPMVDIAKNKQ